MKLDERTSIPLFAVITALPFLIAGVMWLASVDSKASAAQEELHGVRALLLEIRDRVIRIEEHQKQKE